MPLIKPNTTTFDQEVLGADRPVLVDFSANWCPPCQALKPVINKLADELDGQVDVAVVDVDESQELAARYAVSSIPALRLLIDGEIVAERTGYAGLDELNDWIQDHAGVKP